MKPRNADMHRIHIASANVSSLAIHASLTVSGLASNTYASTLVVAHQPNQLERPIIIIQQTRRFLRVDGRTFVLDVCFQFEVRDYRERVVACRITATYSAVLQCDYEQTTS